MTKILSVTNKKNLKIVKYLIITVKNEKTKIFKK